MLILPYLFPLLAAATASKDAASVCREIHSKIPDYTAFDPLGPDGIKSLKLAATYGSTKNSYWDAANEQDRPACMIFPAKAEHVSVAIKALNKKPGVPLAVKSGGHQFNRGMSSTDGGVLISFRPNLASTKLAKDGKTAQVGPGSRWIEAIQTVDPRNKTLVGGRIGHVGVGGYILGGGLSYLTAQYGFASDNVENFEAVLANGTIVNANDKLNPDLFYALRGGGNIFAVVTMFTLKAHDIGNVWGGEIVYGPDKISEFNAAVSKFIANNKDSKAAVIPTYMMIGPVNLVNVLTAFIFYDGPTPPAGTFADFNAITPLLNNTKTQRYAKLVDVPFAGEISIRTTSAVNTLPNINHKNMTAFLDWHWHQANRDSIVRQLKQLDLQLYTMALQPIPVGLQKAAASTGSSPLHMNPDNGDKIWIEYDIGWQNHGCDDVCPKSLKKLIDEARTYQQNKYGGQHPTNYISGDLKTTSYNPLFMNDAQDTQDVLGSYGETNYRRLKSIHQSLDPEGFFTSRQKAYVFRK